eukprot:2832929-Ditylum_brightwellii.AAC.1
MEAVEQVIKVQAIIDADVIYIFLKMFLQGGSQQAFKNKGKKHENTTNDDLFACLASVPTNIFPNKAYDAQKK